MTLKKCDSQGIRYLMSIQRNVCLITMVVKGLIVQWQLQPNNWLFHDNGGQRINGFMSMSVKELIVSGQCQSRNYLFQDKGRQRSDCSMTVRHMN